MKNSECMHLFSDVFLSLNLNGVKLCYSSLSVCFSDLFLVVVVKCESLR